MTAKLKIIARAVIIRLNAGEDIETILDSYPALTPAEKDEIRAYVEEQS